MNKISFLAGVACLVFALYQPSPDVPTPEPERDPVGQAMDSYEEAFRIASARIATKLLAGDLTTDVESRNAREDLLKQGMKQAFSSLAAKEQETLKDGWSPEKEAEILKGYTGAVHN
jgi:hypothetical protein